MEPLKQEEISKFLPEKYIFKNEKIYFEKIIKTRSGEKVELEYVTNGVPILVDKIKKINYTSETVELGVCFQTEGKIGEEINLTLKELRKNNFAGKIPEQVLIHPKFERKIESIFGYIILAQSKNKNIVNIEEYSSAGWYEGEYKWPAKIIEKINENQHSEYELVMQLCSILQRASPVITGVFLAAIHGSIARIIVEAGIDHNFATVIVGKTSSGKTTLSQKIAGYAGANYSLESSRNLLKKIQIESSDMTLVIDDFNKTESYRTRDRKLQIFSELIQTACNSCAVILQKDGVEYQCYNHCVFNSEENVHNLSTLNRMFLINVDDPIEHELWSTIENCESYMYKTIHLFLQYISLNKREICEKIGIKFRHFQEEERISDYGVGNSQFRLKKTKSLQKTIVEVLCSYIISVTGDLTLTDRIKRRCNANISTTIDEQRLLIQKELGKENFMQYLPVLVEVLATYDKHYKSRISHKENSYIRNPEKVAVCLRNGYVSFQPKRIAELISEKLIENGKLQSGNQISSKALSKELKHYGLVFVDCENKASTRWLGSKKRMFHVKVRELLEVTNSDIDWLYSDLMEQCCNYYND